MSDEKHRREYGAKARRDKLKNNMLEFRCPTDGNLLFTYSSDMSGCVATKCRRCKRVYSMDIPVKRQEK